MSDIIVQNSAGLGQVIPEICCPSSPDLPPRDLRKGYKQLRHDIQCFGFSDEEHAANWEVYGKIHKAEVTGDCKSIAELFSVFESDELRAIEAAKMLESKLMITYVDLFSDLKERRERFGTGNDVALTKLLLEYINEPGLLEPSLKEIINSARQADRPRLMETIDAQSIETDDDLSAALETTMNVHSETLPLDAQLITLIGGKTSKSVLDSVFNLYVDKANKYLEIRPKDITLQTSFDFLFNIASELKGISLSVAAGARPIISAGSALEIERAIRIGYETREQWERDGWLEEVPATTPSKTPYTILSADLPPSQRKQKVLLLGLGSTSD